MVDFLIRRRAGHDCPGQSGRDVQRVTQANDAPLVLFRRSFLERLDVSCRPARFPPVKLPCLWDVFQSFTNMLGGWECAISHAGGPVFEPPDCTPPCTCVPSTLPSASVTSPAVEILAPFAFTGPLSVMPLDPESVMDGAVRLTACGETTWMPSAAKATYCCGMPFRHPPT